MTYILPLRCVTQRMHWNANTRVKWWRLKRKYRQWSHLCLPCSVRRLKYQDCRFYFFHFFQDWWPGASEYVLLCHYNVFISPPSARYDPSCLAVSFLLLLPCSVWADRVGAVITNVGELQEAEPSSSIKEEEEERKISQFSWHNQPFIFVITGSFFLFFSPPKSQSQRDDLSLENNIIRFPTEEHDMHTHHSAGKLKPD